LSKQDKNFNYYPLMRYLFNMAKTVDSPQLGILRSIHMGLVDPYMPKFFSFAPEMAEIHRIVGIAEGMSYHVSGYGIFFEESFIRVLSEAIERYCLVLFPHVLGENKIIYASYNDLKRLGEDIPPFEYYQLFSRSDYLRKGFRLIEPSPDHIIGWIKGSSLFDNNKEIFTPAQMAFPGYKINLEKGEKQWARGFSTGAASGTSYQKALISAIAEIIEIDAFSINWYTQRQADRIIFDGTILDNIIQELFRNTDLEPVIFYHSLEDTKIHTMTTFLINKNGSLPAISAGSQSSLDPLHCAYRSLAEATAVSLLGTAGYVYQPTFFTGDKDPTLLADLDSNVAFYSDPRNYQLNMKIINKLTSSKTIHIKDLPDLRQQSEEKNLLYLIKELRNVSKYATAINITTPDIKSMGLRVVKVVIPELMYLCFPSFPYSNHPRMKKYGGVQNTHPHPVP
jgi:thiazole/oxazole-forming peptide maturase SagD family component